MKALHTPVILGTLLCSALTLGIAPSVPAEDSSYQNAITQVSLEQALGQETVPLLDVVLPAGGREAQLDRLLELLQASSERRIHARSPGA